MIFLLSNAFYGVFSVACILFSVHCVIQYFKRRQRSDLVYDNSAFFLMVVSCVALGATILYFLFYGEPQLSLVPTVVAALCLVGLISWHNETVSFTEEGFVVRKFLGNTQHWKYTDITDVGERVLRQTKKRQEVQSIFHVGKKRFSLSHKAVNYTQFAELVYRYGRSGLEP